MTKESRVNRFGTSIFPNGGVCSIATVLADRTTVEAATVGDQGMLGRQAHGSGVHRVHRKIVTGDDSRVVSGDTVI